MIRFRSHLLTLLGIGGFSLAFLIALLTWSGAAPWGGGYTVKAVFPTAASMGSGATVRISGIRVGKVAKVERRGGAAILELKITDAKTPLPRDTRAHVRLRTLVGENYIELTPGKARETIDDGGTLPMAAQQDDYVEADEILSVLRGKTRERAREMIQGFGGGLDGQGERLNGALEHSGTAVDEASTLTSVLDRQRAQVASLIGDLGTVMRGVGDRSAAVEQLAVSGRQTFQAMANRDDGLRSTLEQLPATLRQVRETTGLLRSTSGQTAPVLASVGRALDGLDPVFDNLGPASGEGRRLLASLSRTAPKLEGTLGRLRKLSGPAAKGLPMLRRTMCELNPMLRYLRPYYRDLPAVLSNMAASTNYYDATGHSARFEFLLGAMSAVGSSDGVRSAVDQLSNTGLFNKMMNHGYQPYPKPGEADQITDGRGDTSPRDSSTNFPRVYAECSSRGGETEPSK